MIDGGAQIFEVAACATGTTADADVFTAGFAGDVRELARPPEVVETLETRVELLAVGEAAATVSLIDREHVGDVDQFDIAFFAAWLIARRDIGGELFFRCCNFRRSASCGDMVDPIEDDPARPAPVAVFVASSTTEPEPDAFLWTRHSSLIRLILANVV